MSLKLLGLKWGGAHLGAAEHLAQGPHEGPVDAHELLHVHLVCLVQHDPHLVVVSPQGADHLPPDSWDSATFDSEAFGFASLDFGVEGLLGADHLPPDACASAMSYIACMHVRSGLDVHRVPFSPGDSVQSSIQAVRGLADCMQAWLALVI